MTSIRPFRALRYDPERVALGRVIAPPYDVISADDRGAFYARDPYSAIRLELTRHVEEERTTSYAGVRSLLESWQRDGILIRDPAPALYGLRQQFTAPDGSLAQRDGFFAALRLEDYASRIVRPHELTLAAPKADRLKLMRAARANLSPIFLLYEDRAGALTETLASQLARPPLAVAREDSGASHVLTRWSDEAALTTAMNALADRPVVIADGHHRYETALAYRDEQRAARPDAGPEAPFEFVLAYFANLYAPGSLLLPIHRLILEAAMPPAPVWSERLAGWRRERVAITAVEAIPKLLEVQLAPLADRHAFAVDDGSGELSIFSKRKLEGDDLTIRILHREVIEGVLGLDEESVRRGAIRYPKDALRTARDLREGVGTLALYTNPLTPEDVFRVTAAGEALPQKSTFFYPKLPTGLVFRLLGESP